MRKILAILFALIMSFETKAQSSENLQKIETYLNNLKSLEATFVQMASNGATAEGRLFIKKPNKIRMEYAEPTNVLIVGDGNFIIYNDSNGAVFYSNRNNFVLTKQFNTFFTYRMALCVS